MALHLSCGNKPEFVRDQMARWAGPFSRQQNRDQPYATDYATHRAPGPAARHQPNRSGHDENPRLFRPCRVPENDEGLAAPRERLLRRREPRRQGLRAAGRRAVAETDSPHSAQEPRPSGLNSSFAADTAPRASYPICRVRYRRAARLTARGSVASVEACASVLLALLGTSCLTSRRRRPQPRV